jgi:antitoxin (DNA-binding transcriptional repressor) of toxin-antitoxin stability system
MKASFVDLRRKSREILRALERNEEVTVLYRGRPKAILRAIPRTPKGGTRAQDHPAFGMWRERKDLEDVPAVVAALRKGRSHDL